MFAIAFDLDVEETLRRHPRGLRQAYRDVESVLAQYEFRRIQESVFLCESDSLSSVTEAMIALRAMIWFSDCVTDIRAFRVEQWSDFTPFMKRLNARR